MGRKSLGKLGQLDQLCDEIIVWLFAFIFVLMPTAFGGTYPWAYALTEVLIALALVLWGVRLWLDSSHRLFFSPAVWTMLALCGYAFFEYTRAPIEYSARREILRILLYFSAFFLFINNLRRRRHAKTFAFCLIGIGTLISIYAIAQYVTGSTGILWLTQADIYAHRASGTYICPNHLAGFLEMIIPLALALTLSGRVEQYQKILLGFATLVMLGGVAVTISRAGYLSTLVAVSIVLGILFNRPKYRIPTLAAFVILFGGVIWFLLSSPPEIGSRFDQLMTKNQLEEGRGALYQANMKMAVQKPLLGMGPGSYATCIHRYLSDKTQADPLCAHSDYTQVFIEYGAIGFAGLLLLMTFATLGGIKTWKYVRQKGDAINPKDSTRAALFLGTVGGLAAIGVHSIVDFNMQVPANALLAVVLLAFLTSCLRYGSKSYWIKQLPPVKITTTILILVFSGVLLWSSAHNIHVYRLVSLSENTKLSLRERAALLEDALNLDSHNTDTAIKQGNLLLNYALSAEPSEELDWALVKALQSYQTGLHYNSQNYKLYEGIAMTLTLMGKYDNALPYAKKLMEKRPNGYDSCAVYGWCALYRGDYQEALESLERSIHLKNEGNDFAKDWYEIAAKRLGEEKKFE